MPTDMQQEDLAKLDKQTLITLLMTAVSSNAALQKTIDSLNKNIDLLTEEVHNLRQERFGRKSEKNLGVSDEQYTFIFNETEVTIDTYKNYADKADAASGQEEAVAEEEITYKRKKPVGKRKADLSRIQEREVVSHELSEEELLKLFPDGKWSRLPDEVYERVDIIPATLKVYEHHVAVYKGTTSKKIVRAPRPADPLRNSVATNGIIAALANAKFVNAVPVHRFAQEIERGNNVTISTQDMCYWLNYCADKYLSRFTERLHQEMMTCRVIQADETPCIVNRDGRPAGAKSYMWVYRTGEYEEHPVILYEYQKTRKADHPREFLKDFQGVCSTDGYQVYHTIGDEREDLRISGCWAHAKRRFASVVKTLGKASNGTFAQHAMGLIDSMYHFEKQYTDMAPEERLNKRQERIAPLVDAFFAYLKNDGAKIAPKSKTGEAITYCLNQEKYLRVFLTDGNIPIDNNAAERAIRPFCLGKHNWMVIDTISGAKASAVWYSLAETAKANGLKPYEYFKYLLEQIVPHGEYDDPSFLEDLLPWSEKLPEKCRKKKLIPETDPLNKK